MEKIFAAAIVAEILLISAYLILFPYGLMTVSVFALAEVMTGLSLAVMLALYLKRCRRDIKKVPCRG